MDFLFFEILIPNLISKVSKDWQGKKIRNHQKGPNFVCSGQWHGRKEA
jgi:hypothetical protein